MRGHRYISQMVVALPHCKMFKTLLLLSVLAFSDMVSSQNGCVEYYYWREYNGEIPSDAMPGMTDENGDPIFIAQALHQDKLIPCQIYTNNTRVAYCEFGMAEHKITKNLKVFCTKDADKFYWYPTNLTDVLTLDRSTVVTGGYEPTFHSWIGRGWLYGEAGVGKIISRDYQCWGYYVTYQGTGRVKANSFDILRCSKSPDTLNDLSN